MSSCSNRAALKSSDMWQGIKRTACDEQRSEGRRSGPCLPCAVELIDRVQVTIHLLNSNKI